MRCVGVGGVEVDVWGRCGCGRGGGVGGDGCV